MALVMIKMSADIVNIPWLRMSGLAANLFRLTKQFSFLALAILWEHSFFVFHFFFQATKYFTFYIPTRPSPSTFPVKLFLF